MSVRPIGTDANRIHFNANALHAMADNIWHRQRKGYHAANGVGVLAGLHLFMDPIHGLAMEDAYANAIWQSVPSDKRPATRADAVRAFCTNVAPHLGGHEVAEWLSRAVWIERDYENWTHVPLSSDAEDPANRILTHRASHVVLNDASQERLLELLITQTTEADDKTALNEYLLMGPYVVLAFPKRSYWCTDVITFSGAHVFLCPTYKGGRYLRNHVDDNWFFVPVTNDRPVTRPGTLPMQSAAPTAFHGFGPVEVLARLTDTTASGGAIQLHAPFSHFSAEVPCALSDWTPSDDARIVADYDPKSRVWTFERKVTSAVAPPVA